MNHNLQLRKKLQQLAGAALLCAPLCLVAASASAQGTVYNYGFSPSVGNYSAISTPQATVLATASNPVILEDVALAPVSLPFNFVFNGQSFNKVTISPNGWVAMGEITSTGNFSPLGAGSVNNLLAPLGLNLNGNMAGDTQPVGQIMTRTTGGGANRSFIIQYSNFGRGYMSTPRADITGESYNFQVILRESSNIVQFVYGPFTVNFESNGATSLQENPMVGLRGSSNMDVFSLTTYTDWTNPKRGLKDVNINPDPAFHRFNERMGLSPTVAPVPGLTYTFTPPVSCSSPATALVVGEALARPVGVCNSGAFNIGLTSLATSTGAALNGAAYQWQESDDNQSFTDIAGANGITYTTPLLTATRYYRALISCPGGTQVTSVPVAASVNQSGPAGNTLATAIQVPALPYSTTGNNFATNCRTNNHYFGHGGNHSPDMYYRFSTGSCATQITISTCSPSTDFNTYLWLLNSAGTVLDSNNDGPANTNCGNPYYSSLTYSVLPNTTYYVVVEGNLRAEGNYGLSITEATLSAAPTYSRLINGGEVTLYCNPSVSAQTYHWSGPNGFSSTQQNPVIDNFTAAHEGTYSVQVGRHGCAVSETVSLLAPEVQVNAVMKPEFLFSGAQENTIYLGYGPQSANLEASASGSASGYTYHWTGPGYSASGKTVTVSPVATATYTVTATDEEGFSGSAEVTVYVIDVRCSGNKVVVCRRTGGSNQGYNYTTQCMSVSAATAELSNGGYLGECTNARLQVSASPGTELLAYPNPSAGELTVRFGPLSEGMAKVQLFDVQGRSCGIVFEGPLQAGETREIQVANSNLAAGVYMLHLQANDLVKQLKMVIQK